MLMWYLLVIFYLRIFGSSMCHGVVCYRSICRSWIKESVDPQSTMGLSVDVVIAGHILFKYMLDLTAPWGCLWMWYFMVIAFNNLWVLKVPWGCMLMWYLMFMVYFRICGSSMRHGVVCYCGI